MAIFYLDYVNGNDANNGTSWALAWKTGTTGATAIRLTAGDIIRIAKSPDTTSLGMTATWNNNSRIVSLNSALTANIDLCETAWTASANVTCTTSATRKEGALSVSHAIATAFTTGKVAFKALGSTIDFSGYEQVSFWIQTSLAIAAGVLTLDLCSDTIGATSVNSIAIPAIPAINSWQIVTVDTGAALGSAIQSISLNAISDPGIVTLLMDNILACKASSANNSLTLSSLISKNSLSQGGSEGFYGIKSINGTSVNLDSAISSLSGAGQGYGGITATVTTYKREPIRVLAASSGAVNLHSFNKNGTAGNYVEYQGGYNTSNDIQDGESYFDGQNGLSTCFSISSINFVKLNYVSACRFTTGINVVSSTNVILDNIGNLNNNTANGLTVTSTASSIITLNNLLNANNNGNNGCNLGGANITVGTIGTTNGNVLNGCNINGNNIAIGTINNASYNLSTAGVNCSSGFNIFINSIGNMNVNTNTGLALNSTWNIVINSIANANNNTITGIGLNNAVNTRINSLSTSGNATAGVTISTGMNYLKNAVLSDSTPISVASTAGQMFANGRIYSENHNLTGQAKMFTDGGTIESRTSTLTNGFGKEWLFTTLTNTNRQIFYPLSLVIGRILVNANALVTVSAWFKKGHATDIGAKLVCKGGQLAGVATDVTATKADNLSEELLTITFTPTEAGVIEIEAWAYYINAHSTVIVDALSVSQA